MKLPNLDRATVAPDKLRGYPLSPQHTTGRFEARFFRVLGRSEEDWELLSAGLLRIAREGEAELVPSPFGKKYRIFGDAGGTEWPISQPGDDLDREPWRLRTEVRDSLSGRLTMEYKTLDTVVLNRDLPEYGLRKGDLGAVVHVYDPEGLEVEFVTASGRTEALVSLLAYDVRAVGESDLVSVRTFRRSA